MKILMVTDFFPPTTGGLELHVYHLSAELAKRGHTVEVVTLWQEGLPEFEIMENLRVYRIKGALQTLGGVFSNSKRRFPTPLPQPELAVELGRIVRKEQPDIIHAHGWVVRSLLLRRALKAPKLVVTLHDNGLTCAKKTLLNRGSACSGPGLLKCIRCSAPTYGSMKVLPAVAALWTFRNMELSAVDMFLAVSKATAELNGLREPTERCRVIPNFVPDSSEISSETRREWDSKLPKTSFMLFVGALGEHKGLDVLLRACETSTDLPQLVLMGTRWPDTPARFPQGIHPFEDVPNEAVRYAWTKSIMGLAPSLCMEGCPTSVLEGMAAGRPIIASNAGGLRELVDDASTGVLVPPGDAASLRDAILSLTTDSDRRHSMGVAAAQKAEAFRASHVVPQIEGVYEEVLGR